MTKSQIIIYTVAVLGITIGAYLYTSVAEAPHSLTIEEEALDANEVSNTGESPQVIEPNPTAEPVVPSVPNVEVSTPGTLLDIDWYWIKTIDTAGATVLEPKLAKVFKLRFDNGRMSSNTDCNSIGGDYTIAGSALTFGPLMSTLMYCEGAKETEYSAQLNNVISYELAVGSLRLQTNSGLTMIFEQ